MMFLRLKKLQELYPKSRSSIESDEREGLIPPAVKIGPRAKAWIDVEIHATLGARASGMTDVELREFISGLVAMRSRAYGGAPQLPSVAPQAPAA